MKCKTSTLLISFLAIVFCCVSSSAQEDHDQYGRWINGITEPWTFNGSTYTKDEATAFQQRWKTIGIGLQASQRNGNEWAGDYVRGDLHKTYLRWSPKVGFAYAYVFTCSTGVLGINYGSVEASPAALFLHPALTMTASKSHVSHSGHHSYMFPSKYIPVKWGEQHYLVEEGKIATFYSYVAGVGEYQSDEDFFDKEDDYRKSPEGMPIVPPGYERFVKRPIEGKINAIGTQYLKRVRTMDNSVFYESINPVWVNVGRAHGVNRGMELYVVGSKYLEKVEITNVRKYSSKGFIRRFVDDNNQENYFNNETLKWEKYPQIEASWKLTSSALLSKQF